MKTLNYNKQRIRCCGTKDVNLTHILTECPKLELETNNFEIDSDPVNQKKIIQSLHIVLNNLNNLIPKHQTVYTTNYIDFCIQNTNSKNM